MGRKTEPHGHGSWERNGVLLNGDQRLTIVQIDFRRTTDIILLRYGNLA